MYSMSEGTTASSHILSTNCFSRESSTAVAFRIDFGKLSRIVARPGNRLWVHERFDLFHRTRQEAHVRCARVLRQMIQPRGCGNGDDVRRLLEQPRET